MKIYAVYKGEEMIASGTAKECAEKLGVKVKTIHHYNTPSYKKRVARFNAVTAYLLEGE